MPLFAWSGPMFAGKTSHILQQGQFYADLGKKVLYVKFKQDNRYQKDCITTHNLKSVPALSASTLKEINVQDADVIVIDEGQFFPDLAEMTNQWASSKIILVACLISDFKRNLFSNLIEFIPKVDSLHFLTATCEHCKVRNASFTHFHGTQPLHGNILIGGKETYQPLCRLCWDAQSEPTL